MVFKRQQLGEKRMNVAFYLNQINEEQNTTDLFNKINEDIESGAIDNGSVFYKEIGRSAVEPKFGMFNSTDIWHFTGNLIATSISNVHKALKSVNKFKLSYLYDPAEKNLIGLLELVGRVNIIARNEEEGKEFYRLTGEKPKVLSSFSVKNIKQVLP